MKTKILISFFSFLIVFIISLIFFINFEKQKVVSENIIASPINTPVVVEENKINIFVAGDIMLDRQVRKRIKQFGSDYIFASTTEVIKNADISIANLEGVITNFDSVSAKDRNILRFTFDPTVSETLKNVGFDALSQANNHNNDFGLDGIKQSYDFLRVSNLKPFGDYFNHDDKVATFEKNGFKIVFISWNEFGGKVDRILELIDQYKSEAYYVIVMPHSGIEYEHYPTTLQKTNFRKMIDRGADIIVGTHPHVVESLEIYQNRPIFYSLGNFIFDQNFSYDTTHAITLKIVRSENKGILKEKIIIMPIAIQDSSPSFEEGNEKQKMLDFLASISDVSLKEQIEKGEIDLNNN
ncbi:MAG: CapA family protein [Candidatus Paceibacterota bacterium]